MFIRGFLTNLMAREAEC